MTSFERFLTSRRHLNVNTTLKRCHLLAGKGLTYPLHHHYRFQHDSCHWRWHLISFHKARFPIDGIAYLIVQFPSKEIKEDMEEICENDAINKM